MPMYGEELHLVAMHSRNDDRPCFWGFIVATGLYNSSVVLLNLRCLGIVFDLDETLVVANTMRSFEDRIDALQRKVNSEVDPQRISGMQAEIKRYQEDKSILKQYAENDQVVDNGKVIKVQSELVPALSDSHQPIVRPLIRLHEKNIILTRINPQVYDLFFIQSFIVVYYSFVASCRSAFSFKYIILLGPSVVKPCSQAGSCLGSGRCERPEFVDRNMDRDPTEGQNYAYTYTHA
jgi:hypothetical protein